MNSRAVRTALKVLLILLVVAVVIYRLHFVATAVKTQTVAKGEVIAEVMGTGTLEARIKTTVSSKIQGRVAEMLVDQGERVSAGQLLVRLDDSELQQQVEIAEASLAAARGSVDRVRADEARSHASEEQARQEFERNSTLAASKAISQADLDKATANLRIAEADLRRVAAATTEAELQVVTSQKNLLYQQELLRNTEIVSPFDGLIVRRNRDPGDVVVPGSSILQLISTDEMWISAWVDETAIEELASGQPTRVLFRSEPDKVYAGKLVRLGREVDRETREFLVDVELTELPLVWAVGQRAEIYIETKHKTEALVIAEDLLSWHSEEPGVFINDHGKARWRAVSLGMRGRGQVEILQGLDQGDQLVEARDLNKPLADGNRIVVP